MNTIELKPACKDYLWGGEKLRDNYGIDSPLHPLAEAWMLSCHPDGPSMVASGPHAGKTFPAYIEAVGRGCLGADCEGGETMPIRKGQSLFIPAGTGAYSVTGSSLQCLVTRV